MSILKRILKGQARPAVMRPVPMVPQAAKSEAVQTLELRIKGAMPMPAAERDRMMEAAPLPGARSLLMAAGRIRQAEDSRLAQLERELVMERLRTKELREQLMEMDARMTVLQEAGNSELVEDYERLDPQDVIPWVERVLLPAYGLLVAKLKGGAA